jgi:hypothetical protein
MPCLWWHTSRSLWARSESRPVIPEDLGRLAELSSDFVLIYRELAAASAEHDTAALRNQNGTGANRSSSSARPVDPQSFTIILQSQEAGQATIACGWASPNPFHATGTRANLIPNHGPYCVGRTPLDVSRRFGCPLRMRFSYGPCCRPTRSHESVRRSHWASVMGTAGLLATPEIGEGLAGHDVRILIKLELLGDVAEDQIALPWSAPRDRRHTTACHPPRRSVQRGLVWHYHGVPRLDTAELRRLAIPATRRGREACGPLPTSSDYAGRILGVDPHIRRDLVAVNALTP